MIFANSVSAGETLDGVSAENASDSVASAANRTSWTPDPQITSQIASDTQLLERKLNAAMFKLLSNPRKLEIKITAYDPIETSRGHLQSVSVRTASGEIDHLVLDKADIDFHEVQLDTTKLINEEKIETISVKNINMDVVILESDLNTFLSAKAKNIKVDNPKISLSSGSMELSGSAKYAFMKVRFWATGGFSLQKSQEIWFLPKKLKLNQLTMPRAFVGSIVKKINPVLNLKKFPFRLNLKEIRIEKGALHFSSFRQGQD